MIGMTQKYRKIKHQTFLKCQLGRTGGRKPAVSEPTTHPIPLNEEVIAEKR